LIFIKIRRIKLLDLNKRFLDFFKNKIYKLGVLIFKIKKADKWKSLCCTVGYKWATVMDGVIFEFNGIKSLYTYL